MEDPELLMEELQAATSRMRQLISKFEDLNTQILEIKKELSAIMEEQKALKFRIDDLEKALSVKTDAIERDINNTDLKIEEAKEELESLRNELKTRAKTLESSIMNSMEGLKLHIDGRSEELSSGLSETMSLIKSLDSSVAITKSLVVDLKSNLRVFSKEISENLKQMDEKNSMRQQEIIQTLKEDMGDLKKLLDEHSGLLSIHSEKLLVLQGEVISLRESMLRNFGEVFTKLEGIAYLLREGMENE
ncbi:hypothetical protein JCM16138_17950 [Thermococcus atlanticus]